VNNILIAIEGIDGSGKSTLAKYLTTELENINQEVEIVSTRETKYEHIFQSVLEGYKLNPASEAYMFFFQLLHAHKVDRAIKALSDGKIVIADRWDLSFLAWHENLGFFSKELPELREGISRLAFKNIKPNLGIYLDVPVEKALQRRVLNRGEVISDLVAEKKLYQTGIKAYRELADSNGWITIDASDGLEKVKYIAWELVKDILK